MEYVYRNLHKFVARTTKQTQTYLHSTPLPLGMQLNYLAQFLMLTLKELT